MQKSSQRSSTFWITNIFHRPPDHKKVLPFPSAGFSCILTDSHHPLTVWCIRCGLFSLFLLSRNLGLRLRYNEPSFVRFSPLFHDRVSLCEPWSPFLFFFLCRWLAQRSPQILLPRLETLHLKHTTNREHLVLALPSLMPRHHFRLPGRYTTHPTFFFELRASRTTHPTLSSLILIHKLGQLSIRKVREKKIKKGRDQNHRNFGTFGRK